MGLENYDQIERYIREFRENGMKVIEQLNRITFPERQMLIQSKYYEKLSENSPWLQDKISLEKFNGSTQELSANEKIEDLISQINKNPNEKSLYLNNYLQQYSEISEEDRKVLLEMLVNKDINELKTEIINIIDIFR